MNKNRRSRYQKNVRDESYDIWCLTLAGMGNVEQGEIFRMFLRSKKRVYRGRNYGKPFFFCPHFHVFLRQRMAKQHMCIRIPLGNWGTTMGNNYRRLKVFTTSRGPKCLEPVLNDNFPIFVDEKLKTMRKIL